MIEESPSYQILFTKVIEFLNLENTGNDITRKLLDFENFILQIVKKQSPTFPKPDYLNLTTYIKNPSPVYLKSGS